MSSDAKFCLFKSFLFHLSIAEYNLEIFIFENQCRSYNAIAGKPSVIQFIPALGIIGFAVFGLEPLLRLSRNLFLQEVTILSYCMFCLNQLNSINCLLSIPWCFQRTDWKKSSSRYILTSYFQPLLLWTGVMLICRYLSGSTSLFHWKFVMSIGEHLSINCFRDLDPLVLPSETSQAIKQRRLSFVRSLSTVLTFAYCSSRWIWFLAELYPQ